MDDAPGAKVKPSAARPAAARCEADVFGSVIGKAALLRALRVAKAAAARRLPHGLALA